MSELIFRPEASPGTYTFDSFSYGTWSANWTTARNAAHSAAYSKDTLALPNSGYSAAVRRHSSLGYIMARNVLLFKYNIPAGASIDSAELRLYIYSTIDGINDAYSYISIIEHIRTTGSRTAYVAADHLIGSYAVGTKLSADIDITGISTGAYLDITLNASGLAKLIADGTDRYIYLSVMEGHDIENVSFSPYGDSNVAFYEADEAGTTKDPELRVIYDTVTYAISGTVTLSGTPVTGAVVRCVRQSDNVALTAQTTGAPGTYEFAALDVAELYHVMVEYEDAPTKYNALSLWDIVPVEVV